MKSGLVMFSWNCVTVHVYTIVFHYCTLNYRYDMLLTLFFFFFYMLFHPDNFESACKGY